MTKYDVYGVGNALVDTEFEVDDSFFETHNIEKGFMTLVTNEQQENLIKVLSEQYTVGKRSGGGSASNTLYALSQFGGNAYLSCKVANDENGDFFLAELGHNNIQTNTQSQRIIGTSGRCLIMISPDAERTMHTYLGVSETISTAELDFEAAKNSQYIYLEGYLVTSPTGKEALIELKKFAEENQVKTAMTFSDPSMLQYFKNDIDDVFGSGVDLLFCNLQEALLWTEAETLEEAITIIKTKARQFAITLGAEGALLFNGENEIEISPKKVTAVDTNGAGDMFAGAFLYGITNGKSFKKAGDLASLASATVVSNFGPRLNPAQHESLVKIVFPG